jgi:HD-like signal output (HDOD) protein
VPVAIDIAQIQRAALQSIPLSFRLTGLPLEAHGLLDRILDIWLTELGQERLQEPLSYCLKELINNAWKANAKRIYFEEKGLDIRREADYELGMRDFRREAGEHLGEYLERLRERGLGIAVRFHASSGQLAIAVRNGVEMTPREQSRVFDRVARARAHSSLFESLDAPIDTTEGAGLGILVLLQFLRRLGCGEEAFSIDVENGETIASIVLPMAKVHLDQMRVLTEALVRDIDALPHFPENVLELIRLTSDPNVTLIAIAGKISTDPALTADLLKLVNSAYYMLPGRVNNLLQAVKVVGMKGLRNLLYSYGSQKVLGERYDEMRELWDHSYRTAYYAFLLTRGLKKQNELLDDVYVAGILHDLGRIIVSYLHPDMIERMQRFCASKGIPASVLEKFSFGLNHAEIGSLLARKWNFPEQLVEGIALHHDPLRASQPYKDIVYSVYLANAICDYERGLLVFDQVERPVLSDFGLKTEEQFKALVAKAHKSFEDRKSRF